MDQAVTVSDRPGVVRLDARTAGPIESTFSSVKLRTKVTRGAGSPTAALTMVALVRRRGRYATV